MLNFFIFALSNTQFFTVTLVAKQCSVAGFLQLLVHACCTCLLMSVESINVIAEIHETIDCCDFCKRLKKEYLRI